MKLVALCVVLVSALLASATWAVAEGVTTDAVRPPDLAPATAHAMRVVTSGTPGPGALSGELARLFGAQAYPGAPSAEDVGFTGPRCEIDPGPCDWSEDEPICEAEWVDTWNGGCNSVPSVFDTLYPYYGRITVVGTSGNYLVGAATYRDTDWYEIQLTEATDIRFAATAEFPVQIALLAGSGAPDPCVGYTAVEIVQAAACDEAVIQQTIGPGTYWLWVGPSVFTGIPCGEEYAMTIDGFYAVSCIADCPFGAVHENEDACYPDYVDAWNGGCNSDPRVFQQLDPSAGTITVCGESGVYPYGAGCYRDTDWYEITLDQERAIEVCGFAEFPLQLMILGSPCESGPLVLNYSYANACELACVSDTLAAGTYWLWAGSSTWNPVDCGSRYTMTVSGYTTPVESRSWGAIKALYR
jgi:hypothetical protein